MKSVSISLFVALLICSSSTLIADEGSDRQSYINKWKDVAIEQMHIHSIPASITMAQAILESGNGKSMLSVKANNHFGIKCHGWDGPGVFKDDDKKNECFRKYKSAEDSFEDHSLFLKKQRYAFLFDYDISDYKSWAKGLKKAGYATDPSYAKRLIRLIEDNDLDEFDKLDYVASTKQAKKSKARYEAKSDTERAPAVINVRLSREIKVHANVIKYVEARSGESPNTLAQELNMAPWQIKKYNDLGASHHFIEGEIVFIQPKKKKGKKAFHVVRDGESLIDISQFHGVKLRKLMEYNSLSNSSALDIGTKILLKKPK